MSRKPPTPIVNGLLEWVNGPNGQDPTGRRLAIEVAQCLEIESNNKHNGEVEGLKQESRMLAINIENKDREISTLIDKKIALELILAAQEKELTVLRGEVEALKQALKQAHKQESLQDMRMLAINIENKDREISALTDKNMTLELILDSKDKELTVLRGDIKVYRSTNAFAVSEENQRLRETVAAQEKELKRLREDVKVYRSIEAFQQQLAGEDSSAAKRPRADSPDGSGAQA